MPIPAGPEASLVTLTDAKAQLNIPATDTSNDDELQGFIDAAAQVVENLVGPVTTVDYTEWYDGGQPQIVLRHYPVTAVTSVSEYTLTVQALAAEPLDSTTTFTGYGYTVDLDTGVLSRTSGGSPYRFASGRVYVAYTAGRATVPAAVRLATLKLIEHMWTDQRGGGSGRAVPGGQGDEYLPPETAHLIPWEVEELLAPYRLAPKVA